MFQLPWIVIGPAIALAVVATYFAASRPARAVTRIPIVAALSGRPAPPKQVHRSALPGVVLFVVAAALLSYSGKSNANGGGGAPELVFGIVALIVAIILLAPFCLVVLARFGRRAPIAVRLALRDLARYRARSGSALAAISLGVFIAALVCVLTAQRYGNVLDYAGPNVASNQIIVYTPNGGQGGGPGNGPGGSSPSGTASTPQAQAAVAQNIAKALGSNTVIELDQAGANLTHAAAGRSWSGPIYVATPQLLQAFGIKASDVNPDADILTTRPGLSGISQMQLIYGDKAGQGGSRRQRQRAAHQLAVPGGPVPGQPGDPGGRRASVRHVGAQHRDHRARHPHARPAHQRLGLAHPGPAPADRGADHQRQAHR